MKKTATSRPLSLRRETVRVLAASHLSSVQGGAVTDFTDIIRDRLTDGLINPDIPVTFPTGSNHPGACGSGSIIRTGTLIP
jgi:hypothetical protein